MAEFLQKLQGFCHSFKKNPLTESHHSTDQGIEMVENVLQYVQACSQKAKVLQSLKESSTNKCLKSLELLKQSFSSTKARQHSGLVTLSGYKMTLNMEFLLTLHVENQYAVTQFKNDTFTLYDYAVMFAH